MSIALKTTDYQGSSDPSWLGTAHGTEAAGSGTLDISKFVPATHYPLGFIKGGIAVAQITATKLYGPYTPADTTTGLGTLAGFVLWDVAVRGAKEPFALYDHGKVVTARLPIAVDADGIADVKPRIQFV